MRKTSKQFAVFHAAAVRYTQVKTCSSRCPAGKFVVHRLLTCYTQKFLCRGTAKQEPSFSKR